MTFRQLVERFCAGVMITTIFALGFIVMAKYQTRVGEELNPRSASAASMEPPMRRVQARSALDPSPGFDNCSHLKFENPDTSFVSPG